MSGLSPLFLHALTLAGYFKYPLIFVGAIVEGPILTVASGFLLHQKVFDLVIVYILLVTGDLVGDIAWYYIGYFLAEPVLRRHGKFLSLTPELFEKIKSIFQRKHSIILFVSKITMGFGMALGTLMTAGAARIPLRLFIFYNALGELIYVAILMLIGYYIGFLYNSIEAGFRIIFLFGVLIAVGLALYGFSQYIKKRAINS